MQVEFGNRFPQEPSDGSAIPGPAVTYFFLPDERTCAPGASIPEVALHLARSGQVTHLPDQEALVEIIRVWPTHSEHAPVWVWSDNKVLEDYLSEFYGCPAGRPENLEEIYYTQAGPPGIGLET